jgi:hypothetical protein
VPQSDSERAARTNLLSPFDTLNTRWWISRSAIVRRSAQTRMKSRNVNSTSWFTFVEWLFKLSKRCTRT